VKLPPKVQQQIQSYHSATNEILRHFWSSFEPYRADKNPRMIEALKKQKEKLKDILQAVASYDGDQERCELVIS
jgi:transcription initiation factor TFIIH subunit 1